METELILRIACGEADIEDLETNLRNFISQENIGISLFQFDYLNKRWNDDKRESALIVPYSKLTKTEQEIIKKDYKEQKGKDGVFECGNKHKSISEFWANHSNANDYPNIVLNHIYRKEYLKVC